MLKIGIIGGTGWMGKAMGDALLKKLIKPEQLWVSNQSGKNNYSEAIHFTTDTQALINACDVVILSVRTEQFPPLKLHAENKLVISVMARVEMTYTEKHLNATRVIRSMPNVAIVEEEGYTPWIASADVTAEDKKIAQQIFNCFGAEDEVATEDQLNFLTALTGSSHGWLVYVANALVQAGLAHGLERPQVEHAIRQVMKGIGQLIAHEERSPQESLEFLLSYSGTTTAGLRSFISSNIAELIQKGIETSYVKACEKRAQ